MPRAKLIVLKMTVEEAEALIDAGNAGIADMHDAGDDESRNKADIADRVLDRLGQLFPRD